MNGQAIAIPFQEIWVPPAQIYPARAIFDFGLGWLGEVLYAADIPAGIFGGRGKLAAFPIDADAPALLRKGALEDIGGQ